jgi:hypothetical protein
MARNLQTHKPGAERDYIPSAFGNDKENSPIKVVIKHPSEGDRRRIISEMKVKVGANGEVETELKEQNIWIEKALKQHVMKIENYSIGGQAITNGVDLWEFGEQELIDELITEIMQGISEDNKKKSKG